MHNTHDLLDKRILTVAQQLVIKLKSWPPKLIKLDEPYQRGWDRKFVLTDQAERRKDRDVLLAILEVIGTTRFSGRSDFTVRQRKSRAIIEIKQSVRRIWDHEWERKRYPSRWYPHFRWIHFKQWGRPRFYAEFTQPGLFQLKTEPHWIHYVHEIDPAAERQRSELESWMTSHNGWNRYCRLKGRGNGWKNRYADDRDISLRREHRQAMWAAMLNPSVVDHAAYFVCGAVHYRWLFHHFGT